MSGFVSNARPTMSTGGKVTTGKKLNAKERQNMRLRWLANRMDAMERGVKKLIDAHNGLLAAASADMRKMDVRVRVLMKLVRRARVLGVSDSQWAASVDEVEREMKAEAADLLARQSAQKALQPADPDPGEAPDDDGETLPGESPDEETDPLESPIEPGEEYARGAQ